jgi:putative DNA methylase
MPLFTKLNESEQVVCHSSSGKKAIENGFLFCQISSVAEAESWRKEVYRPIYHVHKWWAQRLGSVFRGIILASAYPENSPIRELFYRKNDLGGLIVFDPFMGSGTTIGEAVKLGCTAIGRDINPVAFNSVRAMFSRVTTDDAKKAFANLENDVGKKIKSLYQLGDGSEILYYFWVKRVACPDCGELVDLFNHYVFSRHAYPLRNPKSECVCPFCNEVFSCRHDSSKEKCPSCGAGFNPQVGPSGRTKATCNYCHSEFSIVQAVKAAGRPPTHRMYAKMILRPDGKKEYRRITEKDILAFDSAREMLKVEKKLIQELQIEPGHNTNQALNYCYTRWDQFFNERQLLALSWLGKAIKEIENPELRFVFTVLFSGTLEFNNMFCSFKGEGTGAVRHMFSHHILKPERQPLEANVWGTPRSSGSFSTLFKSRLLRALEYKRRPFEVEPKIRGEKMTGSKRYDCNEPISDNVHIAETAKEIKKKSVYLSCGDSACTDLEDKSVDLVITDPPFFDNVHYSELADFFWAWQLALLGETERKTVSTRCEQEVQDGNARRFSEKLANVFKECNRILRDDGILAFTYHHSREEGWSSVAHAVKAAGFSFMFAQPVKAEMSVATPKSQAKEPIDMDIILVCRKSEQDVRSFCAPSVALEASIENTRVQIEQFWKQGRRLSRNDLRIIIMSHLLVTLSTGREEIELLSDFRRVCNKVTKQVEEYYSIQELNRPKKSLRRRGNSTALDSSSWALSFA